MIGKKHFVVSILAASILTPLLLGSCITIVPTPQQIPQQQTPETTVDPEPVPQPVQDTGQAILLEDSFVLTPYCYQDAENAGLLHVIGFNYILKHSALPFNNYGYYISRPFYLLAGDYIDVLIISDCPASIGPPVPDELEDAPIMSFICTPEGTEDTLFVKVESYEVKRAGDICESHYVCSAERSGEYYLSFTHRIAMGFPDETSYPHECSFTISTCGSPE